MTPMVMKMTNRLSQMARVAKIPLHRLAQLHKSRMFAWDTYRFFRVRICVKKKPMRTKIRGQTM